MLRSLGMDGNRRFAQLCHDASIVHKWPGMRANHMAGKSLKLHRCRSNSDALTAADAGAQVYDGLLNNITRPRYIPVYRQFKDLLCCDLTHTMQLTWAAWTATATATGAPCT